MKTKCLLYLLQFLCFIQFSYGQTRNTAGITENVPGNQIPNSAESNENLPPQQSATSEETESLMGTIDTTQEQTNPVQDILQNNVQNYQLPEKIKEYLKGYENFVTKYAKDIEEEKDPNGNLHCIKALLSTVHYPILYESPEHYYNTVCNENTNIEPLKYLQSIINNKDICKENGNNYQTAYNMIRVRHYLNCLKDMESGKYCYETNQDFYNKLLQDEISNFQNKNSTFQNKKDSFKSSFVHMCMSYENKNVNEIPFCSKMAIIGNSISNKLITENITLEVYYSGNQTYKLDLKLNSDSSNEDDYSLNKIYKTCRTDDVFKSLNNNNNLDEPTKGLMELYKNGSLSLHCNIISILAITLFMSISFIYM